MISTVLLSRGSIDVNIMTKLNRPQFLIGTCETPQAKRHAGNTSDGLTAGTDKYFSEFKGNRLHGIDYYRTLVKELVGGQRKRLAADLEAPYSETEEHSACAAGSLVGRGRSPDDVDADRWMPARTSVDSACSEWNLDYGLKSCRKEQETMPATSCPNRNHRRANAPVRYCPVCGEVVNAAMPAQKCSADKHAKKRRERSKYCSDCGEQLIRD